MKNDGAKVEDKQLKLIMDRITKAAIGFITLKPVFKLWFSFKGLVISLVVINVYYIGNELGYLINWSDMEFEEYRPYEYFVIFISIIYSISIIAIVLYLKKIHSFYVIGKTQQSLRFAKSLGVLKSSEYEVKLLESKKADYINEVKNMQQSGIFNNTQKHELIEMAEDYYSKKMSEISIQQSFENGVLTKKEYETKLQQLKSAIYSGSNV